MNNQPSYIVLEKPETAKYVVYSQSTSSEYITFTNNCSLVPSSLHQIMKNNIIVNTPIQKELQRCESAGKPF